jgi:hypothetical protein
MGIPNGENITDYLKKNKSVSKWIWTFNEIGEETLLFFYSWNWSLYLLPFL